MATSSRNHLAQQWVQYLLPVQTLTEAQNLARRLQAVEGFRDYVLERKLQLIPIAIAVLLLSVACAVAPVVFLAEIHRLLALPALLLLPVILIGSLLVLGFVVLAWLENRSLAFALGHRIKPPRGSLAAWLTDKTQKDFTTLPRVPWILAALFLAAPVALLASFAMGAAIALILLAILAPVTFVLLDR